MANGITGSTGCRPLFLRASLGSGIARSSSSNVSTYVRSWAALAIAIICGGVTFFVLFEDVLRHGTTITTDHVLTLAVLAIVAAAGHMWWQQMRHARIILALGLLLVCGGGLVYLVVASGGRNAEVMIAKRNAAAWANTERARIEPLLARAEQMLSGSMAKIQADCVEGKKGKGHCDGLRTTQQVYAAAVTGHKSDLAKLGPPTEADAALKSTAKVMVAWQDVADAKEREAAERRHVERLELLLPYLKATLVELATVVFAGVAIGHRATVAKVSPATVAPPTTVARPATVAKSATVTVLRPLATVANNAEALALQLLQRRTTVAQGDIVQLFGGDKSKASRWLTPLERDGRLVRTSAGRSKLVALA